jgi:hypothetical protein
VAVLREPKDGLSGENPDRSSDHLFECINRRAMTIRCQSLQIFEDDGTDKNDAADTKDTCLGEESKEDAKGYERNDVLIMGLSPASKWGAST